ncbi:hypothetical protein TEA_000973 [Camellia sinensis var. sinensis]|uniref:Btz domain-containing protein n=1 Tax=Camellia sinensis var. sinensis TaxID=542762 RepID=A0A4S4E912_CAMSN|nr:hypothetical protein TEA_000973 [Camellia sinensis var. sinensis]
MAAVGEEEGEYESDPEELKRSLTMRRREASDDEGEEGDGGERERRRVDSMAGIASDGESEGQGAPADYDDDESEIEEEEELEEYEEEELGVGEEEVEVGEDDERGGKDDVDVGNKVEAVEAGGEVVARELDGDRERSVGESTEVQGVNQVEEEKKENEPFAVPTAGAFYMHDDRFRDNAAGRHRVVSGDLSSSSSGLENGSEDGEGYGFHGGIQLFGVDRRMVEDRLRGTELEPSVMFGSGLVISYSNSCDGGEVASSSSKQVADGVMDQCFLNNRWWALAEVEEGGKEGGSKMILFQIALGKVGKVVGTVEEEGVDHLEEWFGNLGDERLHSQCCIPMVVLPLLKEAFCDGGSRGQGGGIGVSFGGFEKEGLQLLEDINKKVEIGWLYCLYGRTLGGRKLWESKDNRKWGHDKFEEMTLQDRRYEEGTRNSRGNYRARGKNRGIDRGYTRGNKSKAYNNNNQNNGPKSVRGRGPRRYEPLKNIEAPPMQYKHRSGKSIEKTSHHTSGRAPTATSNADSDTVSSRKQAFGSSLSSASPPFYPSGSNKEITLTQKRDAQAGTINRNPRSAVVDENFSMSQSNSMMRGKNVVEKLHINDSISANTGKPSTSLPLPPSGSFVVNTTQPLQPRVQGRGLASVQMTFQPGALHNQVSRASPPTQHHTIQRNPAQSRVQPSLQASVQQSGQRPGSGSQTSSPPKAALSINSFESGELESPPESSKSKTALVGKGKGGVQGSGMSSFLYGGAQVMGTSGSMGSGHGDQNFGATPAFLPVMPFGGQHPGGMGVPAVGMAFPGYVAQPQLGLGNSEMTWLPVLAGAAGALGATYCSPYITVDGAYHSRPSGQASSSGASRSCPRPFVIFSICSGALWATVCSMIC